MEQLHIQLLGGFRVTVGAREIADGEWHLRKAKALVKLLALAPGHALQREQVLEILWPDLDPEAAAGQLRKALHEARRVLVRDPAATYRYLESGELLRLRRGTAWVDVQQFEDAALHARRTGDPSDYQAAIDLYAGDLLPEDLYEDWAAAYAGPLRAEVIALLLEQAKLMEARARFDEAGATLRRIRLLDPVHEEAGAALMRVCALAGRRHDALLAYDQLAQTLRRELGTDPGPETVRLFEQIRSGADLEPQLTSDLWEQVGDLRLTSGDFGGSAAAFVASLGGAGESPDRTGREARLHRKAAQSFVMNSDPLSAGPHLDAAERLLAGRPDEPESGRVLRVRADLQWAVGRGDEGLARESRYRAALETAEASLRIATRHGLSDDIAEAHETLAIVHHLRGEWREGLKIEIERLGSATGSEPHLERIFEFHCCIGEYHLYGDLLRDSVEDYARATLQLALDKGARHAQAFAWCLLGESLLLQGRWDEAQACLERSTATYAELDARSGVLPWQRLAELAASRGDSERAADCLRQGMGLATVTPLASHAWGRLYATAAFDALERGDPAEAVRAVRAAAAAGAHYGECPSCTALLNPMAAEAFAALDDRPAVAAYVHEAERVAGSFQSAAWSAMAQAAAGSQALTDGDRATARRCFLEAADLYDQARQPFWAARTRAQAARTGAGGPADRDLLEEASRVFERLGATRELADAGRPSTRHAGERDGNALGGTWGT
ncbi:BTAD domain-containing putative transcriptional regulator [Rhodococcus daqingensis]|uniref:BTAD domain-containing putative transcriptional regulator n=1 Tax=Rhodococcus daqingensis TaxID=2479363 RepID=A0ABW2RTS0_9NOCA